MRAYREKAVWDRFAAHMELRVATADRHKREREACRDLPLADKIEMHRRQEREMEEIQSEWQDGYHAGLRC